jgi:hypothetical protein
MTPDQSRDAYDRDSKMWAFMVSELADTKALLNTMLALVRIQLERSGVPPEEVDSLVTKHVAQYRKDAQDYSKKLLELASIPPVI